MPQTYTLTELRKHCQKGDAWIAYRGSVYDITRFISLHPGWEAGCGVSTVIAIMRNLGCDCTEEFDEIHSALAKKQLQEYWIGILDSSEQFGVLPYQPAA